MPSPIQPKFTIDQKVVRLYKTPYVEGDEYEIGKVYDIFRDSNGDYFYQITQGQGVTIPEVMLEDYNDFFNILL